ncbi:tail assembly protein [Vibrio vulnificus]|uniref:tail assembly protein n=1 Tax=Vibrio vulnificus TaxID=672 RepID=UPI001FB0399F|nr:tail assembly protein [Vibrio vulnificus]MCJ0804019.1 tail assembly protein [Vibrio vulnificus]
MSQAVIYLSGSLAKQFGRRHVYDLDSGAAKEAFSALTNTIEGFEQFIRAQAKKGIRYAIFRNRENIDENDFSTRGTREIRIVPVIEGSKRQGVFQTVLGVVLIAAGAYLAATPFGAPLMNAGIALVAGGVIQMLSPQAKKNESSEPNPSYAFGGPVNTSASGHIVGIGYGERLIGGSIISAGIYAEDHSTYSAPTEPETPSQE